MAPNGKKKADSPPSFEDVEAKRVEVRLIRVPNLPNHSPVILFIPQMVKSLSAVADAFEAATSSVRAYLDCAPHALTEPPALAADGSKKRKAVKEKKVKDPNAPKRPVTGYLAYSKDQMPKLKEANPTMPHKVLVGLITEQWTNLPEEEKKVNSLSEGIGEVADLGYVSRFTTTRSQQRWRNGKERRPSTRSTTRTVLLPLLKPRSLLLRSL